MELSQFKSELSFKNKLLRLVWGWVWLLLFRPSPRTFHSWRAFLLKVFGASLGKGTRVYNSAKVYYPPNLRLGDQVVIGPDVDVYCVAPVTIGSNSMVSQYAYLCAASHDYQLPNLPLIASPINIGERTWICAKAFIGPGVTLGDRCVVGACSVVVKDSGDRCLLAGNPARVLKTIKDADV